MQIHFLHEVPTCGRRRGAGKHETDVIVDGGAVGFGSIRDKGLPHHDLAKGIGWFGRQVRRTQSKAARLLKPGFVSFNSLFGGLVTTQAG